MALLFTNHLHVPHRIDFGDRPPLVAIPISPPISTIVYLSYRKNETLSDAAARFLKLWKQARAGLIDSTEVHDT